MRGRFVKLLNHDMNITEDVGPVMSIDQNVENVFPQELALMKLLNVAAEQSASFHASDSVLHGVTLPLWLVRRLLSRTVSIRGARLALTEAQC